VPSGPCVVLTREQADNLSLARELHARGVPVREIPCAATVYLRPDRPPELPVGCVAFASRRAVRGFVAAGLAEPIFAAGAPPPVAAVGPATCAELERHQLGVDLLAEPPTGQALAELLHARLGPGEPVLVPRGRLTGGALESALAALERPFQTLVVYDNPAPEIPAQEPFPVAAVFVAAPSAACRLLAALPWLLELPFVAIGPTTEQALLRLGARSVRVAAAGGSGPLEALLDAWRSAGERVPDDTSSET